MKKRLALAFTLILATIAFSASPALAAAEPHPKIGPFGSFTNPNGIAVDEATGDVYVADIATTNSVYKFDANGTPVNFNFPAGSKEAPGNTLEGADTPAESFSFPSVYGSPAAIAVDNACVAHTPALTGKACEEFDPSAGDLYVMDAGHGVIDKFSPAGGYLSQMGGFEGELLGLGVAGSGTVHVDLNTIGSFSVLLIDEFDDAAVNHLIARQDYHSGDENNGGSGLSAVGSEAHGFAVSATGDDYQMYEPSCSCTLKFGQKLSPLGLVDGVEAGGVAVAVNPATGHLYADDQSSVAEWDTGAMNRNSVVKENGPIAAGTLVARFGSPELSGTSGHGGIAVNGKTGEIYVANPGEGNPGEGKVYVFASDAPAVTAGEPTGVTTQAASLSGAVDPRGVAVGECKFEYGLTDELGSGPYNHSVPCEQSAAEIGEGISPVAVSAQLQGLQAGELYHFRLVATNADGAGQGSGMLAMRGVGFGIKSFEISFLNEDGTADTQAGSHPFKFINSFTLNSHFKREESNADSAYIRLPDGVLRNLKIDLPPGFVGNPNAPSQHCTGQELRGPGGNVNECQLEAEVGELSLFWSKNQQRQTFLQNLVFAMTPVRGVALQLGTPFFIPLLYIDNGVLAGGNYPVQVSVTEAPTSAPVISSRAVLSGLLEPCVQVKPGTGKYEIGCQERTQNSGVGGTYERGSGPAKAFLTMPTGCHGPLGATIEAESWEEPGRWATKSTVTHNSAGTPLSLTGCSKLRFPAEIGVKPDTTDASTSSGLTVNVHVPQTAALNPNGLAESALRDTTVALPEGVAINPSGGGGLEARTSEPAALGGALGSPGDQIGYKGQEELNKEYEPGVKWNTFTSEVASPLAPGTNFTGPYNGSGACTVGQPGCAPFGITFEVPAKAGPFDLANTKSNHPACDCVVVRGKIELNPLTAAITITTDPPGSPDSIPTSIEGIPLEIQHVNATTTRGDFQFNPTSCAKMSLTGTVLLSEGGSSTISTPFQVTNCAALKFEPKFSVSTSGKTSKANGASLTAKVTYPNVPQGTDADLAKVKVELPKQLPSRLTTLQKACTDKQFEANPAACPSESKIGYATVHTPLIPVPLTGPVIFVSHGGEAFPSLTMVLQGYGITIDLVGTTFISKAGITSTTFKTVPDQPFSSFELTLPEGKYSALAANGNLCSLTKTVTVKKKVTVRSKGHKRILTRSVTETTPVSSMQMPTEFVAQNGAEIHQNTPIAVTGCTKAKPAKKAKKKGRK